MTKASGRAGDVGGIEFYYFLWVGRGWSGQNQEAHKMTLALA